MRVVAAAVAVTLALALAAAAPAQAAPDGAAPAVSQPQRPNAWLGVSLSSAASSDSDSPAAGAADQPPGVRVDGIIDGSPAEEAGLRESDWILSIEGTPVRVPSDLIAAVRSLDPDTWAALEVQRGKTVLRLRVRLSSRSTDGSSYRLRRGWIGVKGIDLPPSLRTFFGAPQGSGILVSDVETGGAAESAGLAIGDVVFSAGGAPVSSSGDFERLVTRAGVGNKLEIHLMRYGAEITVEPTVARQPNEKSAAR